MTIKIAMSGLAILLLTACGGADSNSSSGNQDASNSKTGYDPNLKEQTITEAELQSVQDIAEGNTVTIQGDATLLAASPDLVVKGNLIIK